MTCEQAIFDSAVADIFGFNAVQLGLPQQNLLRVSRIPLHIKAGKEAGVHLWLEAEELPFETGSIDLVVLPHMLEFSMHPHQILREAERVLMPEGQVIVSGFNPFSLWGLPRYFAGRKRDYPWRGNFIALARIKDWLALLGLEVVAGRMCCYTPPLRTEQWLRRFHFMEAAGDRWWALAGGVYFLQAKKKVIGMRLITPNWNKRAVARKSLAVAPQKSTMNKIPQ